MPMGEPSLESCDRKYPSEGENLKITDFTLTLCCSKMSPMYDKCLSEMQDHLGRSDEACRSARLTVRITRLFLFALVTMFALVSSGCHTLNVTMQNNANVPLAPSLVVTSKGIPQPAVGAGTVAPAGSVTKTLKLRNGDSYVVDASLPSSATVFGSAPATITSSDPKVIDVTVPMSSDIPNLNPDDPQSIKAAFSALGPNVGFNPETVQSVNDSFFGGLVILSAPVGGDPTAQQIVAPGVLTSANVWNDSQYPQTTDTSTAKVTTASSANVSASVPLWGTITSNFSLNNVYEVDWDMEGFGMISKKEDPAHSDFITAMTALPPAEKASICSSLQASTTSLMYVNQMYVVKRINYNVTQGNSIAAGASASGGAIISGSIAYSFTVDNNNAKTLEAQVVNIGGPTWTHDNAPLCQAPVAAPPPPAAAGSVVPPTASPAAVPQSKVLAARRLLKSN